MIHLFTCMHALCKCATFYRAREAGRKGQACGSVRLMASQGGFGRRGLAGIQPSGRGAVMCPWRRHCTRPATSTLIQNTQVKAVHIVHAATEMLLVVVLLLPPAGWRSVAPIYGRLGAPSPAPSTSSRCSSRSRNSARLYEHSRGCAAWWDSVKQYTSGQNRAVHASLHNNQKLHATRFPQYESRHLITQSVTGLSPTQPHLRFVGNAPAVQDVEAQRPGRKRGIKWAVNWVHQHGRLPGGGGWYGTGGAGTHGRSGSKPKGQPQQSAPEQHASMRRWQAQGRWLSWVKHLLEGNFDPTKRVPCPAAAGTTLALPTWKPNCCTKWVAAAMRSSMVRGCGMARQRQLQADCEALPTDAQQQQASSSGALTATARH